MNKRKLIALMALFLGATVEAKKSSWGKSENSDLVTLYNQIQNSVDLTIETLPRNDRDPFTHKDVLKKFSPVRITIHNKSRETFLLKGENLGLSLVHPKKAFKKAKFSSFRTLLKRPEDPDIHNLLYPNYHSNWQIREAFKRKATNLETPATLTPNKKFEKIVYVDKKKLPKKFDIKLENTKTNKLLTFNANLK